MINEEPSVLEEELAGARAELEALRDRLADREARASHLEAQLATTREELARAVEESRSRDEALTQANERAETLDGRVRAAAERYRALALERSPELPGELVAGESVEEIEVALAQARETVAKVRGHLESEAQAGRVPVGAPARSAPDLSGLSAEEKIRRGLDQQPR